jgi:2-polyprenyl-3-methyl-5-hydroxy-6-metoxy-1,4-benzoquinol methylase
MTDQVNGLFSPFLRAKRIEAARPFLKGEVLDYGCGVGMLSKYVDSKSYTGVDIDDGSIAIARNTHPDFSFFTVNNFNSKKTFDTIVGLAIIEHLKKPDEFLVDLKTRLRENGKIVLTTPHPASNLIHYYGSNIGLFSKDAEDEHETLIDYEKMVSLAAISGLKITLYKRFLLGYNQLFILQR